MNRVLPLLLFGGLLLSSQSALAQMIYKYEKSDGTIVYTDSLADLPADRRAYYNKLEEERREQEEAAAERAAARGQKPAPPPAAEAAEPSSGASEDEEETDPEVEQRLKDIRKSQEGDVAGKAQWQARIKTAKQKLKAALANFTAKQEALNGMLMRQSYALPGEGKQRESLKKELKKLEKDIDALIIEINETIPQQARKAGVPPGWLR